MSILTAIHRALKSFTAKTCVGSIIWRGLGQSHTRSRLVASQTERDSAMSTTTAVNTVIVGAGQAGLAVSYYLSKLSQDHVVLEQAEGPGEAWRNHRWDSFTLNTPRWQSRLPGVQYGEDDPDGFMPRDEVVAHFENLARPLPVRYRTRVRGATTKPVSMMFRSRMAS